MAEEKMVQKFKGKSMYIPSLKTNLLVHNPTLILIVIVFLCIGHGDTQNTQLDTNGIHQVACAFKLINFSRGHDRGTHCSDLHHQGREQVLARPT